MADDTDEDEAAEPAVELGEQTPVEGAPLARVASRLTWPLQQSEVIRREGESVLRTPDGPMKLSVVLEDVDVTYFESRHEFEEAVRAVIGTGPIPTE